MSDNDGLDEDGGGGPAGMGVGTSAGDEGCTIPKNAINHIVKRVFAELADTQTQGQSQVEDGSAPTRVSQEARDALAFYGVLFIRCVTDKTNEKVLQQSKKIMAPDMLLETLSQSGHGWLTRECDSTAEEGRAKKSAAKRRKLSSKLESLGIPEEELLRQQQALFHQARSEIELTSEDVDAIRDSGASLPLSSEPADGDPALTGVAHQEGLDDEDFDI